MTGRKKINPRCMVLKRGSPAMHKLGDIGSTNSDELIDVFFETKLYYIGTYFYGFGFINVKFKKEDVRPITEKELEELRAKKIPWELDSEGYYIGNV